MPMKTKKLTLEMADKRKLIDNLNFSLRLVKERLEEEDRELPHWNYNERPDFRRFKI